MKGESKGTGRRKEEAREGKGFKESRGEMEQKGVSRMREEDGGGKRKMRE